MAKRIYNQTALFGELYAYLVVISPPDDVMAEIMAIKADANAIADISDRNLHSKPHITLTDKLTDDPALRDTVAGLLKGQKSFQVSISGVAEFEHKHNRTLYFKVENPEPIAHLGRLLKMSLTPHLAIAKKIKPDIADVILPYLESLNYRAQWTCTEIVVLRKLMSEKEKGFVDKFVVPLDA